MMMRRTIMIFLFFLGLGFTGLALPPCLLGAQRVCANRIIPRQELDILSAYPYIATACRNSIYWLHDFARCVFHQQPTGSAGVADKRPESSDCSTDFPLRMSVRLRNNARMQSLHTSLGCLPPCGKEIRTWKYCAASFKPTRATGSLSKAAANSRKRRT